MSMTMSSMDNPTWEDFDKLYFRYMDEIMKQEATGITVVKRRRVGMQRETEAYVYGYPIEEVLIIQNNEVGESKVRLRLDKGRHTDVLLKTDSRELEHWKSLDVPITHFVHLETFDGPWRGLSGAHIEVTRNWGIDKQIMVL